MAKRKSSNSESKKDVKVTAIIIGLFAAAVILFLIFSKAKESPQETQSEVPTIKHVVYKPVQEQPVETSYQPENNAPVEENPQAELNVSGGGKVAIILDDWGYTMMNCHYLSEIKEPLAVSVLPGLRHTKDAALCAQRNNKVVMLHLPLEALHNGDFYPPNYIIKTTMPASLVTKIVEDDLAQFPSSLQGVNNHMGSKATADAHLMRIILKILKPRGLFFVDSMTNAHSVSAHLAGEMGLSYARRDVFLDDINTREAITKQIMILAKKARRRGYAIAIGHDRHLTLQVLKDEIPWLEKQGITLVSIKDLLSRQ